MLAIERAVRIEWTVDPSTCAAFADIYRGAPGSQLITQGNAFNVHNAIEVICVADCAWIPGTFAHDAQLKVNYGLCPPELRQPVAAGNWPQNGPRVTSNPDCWVDSATTWSQSLLSFWEVVDSNMGASGVSPYCRVRESGPMEFLNAYCGWLPSADTSWVPQHQDIHVPPGAPPVLQNIGA